MADLERLIQAIDAAEQTAYGSDSDSDLQSDRAVAIDLYHGRNIEPAASGRSQVVDRTVFETIQWILPSLCRIFANGDDIVEFAPFGPEDEEPAKQEGDYLNYIVTQKNRWLVIFHMWAMDALLSKNGYCLPYIEEKIQTELETYERQSDEGLAFLMQEEGIEVVEHTSEPDPQNMVPVTDDMGQPVPIIDPMTGQPAVDPQTGEPRLQMQPRTLHTVTLKKTKPKKKLCFKVLPPERTKCDIDLESFLLEDANYFAYWDFVTISYLRSLGFDVPDDIASGDDETDDTEEGQARDLYSEESTGANELGAADPAMRKVRARCVWIRHDTDEDGIAELQQVYRVGQEILEKNGKPFVYHVSRIPVACITPNINPHRHIGTSEADIAGDIQRIRTAMLRGGLDGFYLAVNPRSIVSNEVNLDDLMVSRPGGITRMIEGSTAIPGEGHVMPIVTQNTLPDAIAGLEYMGTVLEGRTGVSRSFAGVDPSALNKGNSSGVAINQLSTMAAQRIEHIARVFAVGVEYLFSVAHELVIKSGHQAEVVKLRGNWVQIDPSTWKTGRDMRVCVGYGAGNKDALVSRLMLIANIQKEMMAGGLPNVTPQNLDQTAIEIVKASDFTSPRRFFTDPSTVQPSPPKPTEAEIYAGVEQAKLASAEKIKGAEIQSAERTKQAELLHKDQLAQLEAEVKILLEQMKGGQTADIERIRQSGSVQLEQIKGEKSLQLEHTKGALKNEPEEKKNAKLDGIAKLIAELREAQKSLGDALNAPREVVRGKDGRVAGVKVGGVERKVKRDNEGRVTGLQ